MAEAGDKGIPLEDYIKVHEQPEPLVRAKLDRGELRYTWIDVNGNARASDDGGPQPPKGWWLRHIRPRSIASGVRCGGMPLWFRPSSRCFSSRCTPRSRQRLSTRRKKLPAGGVPARHRWFWKRRNGDYKGAIERSTYSEAVTTFWRGFRIGSAIRTPKPGQWQPRRSATIFARMRTSGLFCRNPGSGENNPLSRLLRFCSEINFGRKNALSEQE